MTNINDFGRTSFVMHTTGLIERLEKCTMIKYRDKNGEIQKVEGDLFVTKDKNGKDVFVDDEVLVYKGKKNIGEGYVFFNERFLWWTVNNSNQDNDRESPEDWSQLSLCDVDIEILEDEDNE